MYENVPAVSTADHQQVLGALERLQAKLVQKEEWSHSEILGAFRETLQSPLLGHILTLQHSIKQLKDQLSSMPADAHSDYSFSRRGQLIVRASRSASSLAPPSQPHLSANGSSPLSSNQLQRWILSAAQDRPTDTVTLSRPVSGGLGFSIMGLKPEGTSAQGVFITHIQPGGLAHKDSRLQERDQILVINGIPLDTMAGQQQALALLQQPGNEVELVVARDHSQAPSSPVIMPIDMESWGHMEEMELVNDGSGLGFGIVGGRATGVVVRTLIPNSVADQDGRLRTGDHILRIGSTPTSGLSSEQVVKVLHACGSRVNMLIARDPRRKDPAPLPPPPPPSAPVTTLPPLPQCRVSRMPNLDGYEIHDVSLTKKDGQSLGISIIGHNALTSQDAVGVFVKHVVPGSAADQSGSIHVHDRLIALDGVSLQGFTNQEVLEVMKQTGQTVLLTLVRKKPTRSLERSLDKVERESSRVSLKRSAEVKARSADLQRASVNSSTASTQEPVYTSSKTQPSGAVDFSSVFELRAKWEQALGPQYQVMVVELDPVIEDDAELQRYSKLLPIHTMRLGMELDSFDGHHYISSVAPGGPVGKHGILRPEDELLEVNGVQLYGKSRREAVAFLKEVPPPFTLVCCRHLAHHQPDLDQDPEPQSWRVPSPTVDEIELKLSSLLSSKSGLWNNSTDQQEQEALQESSEEVPATLSQEEEERGMDEDEEEEELALWSPDIQVLELEKERDKGLGFSILDYQDPLDPGRCVMVIRSLVPDGAAERHGGLIPGDQLVSVNHNQLDSLSLAQAVEVLKATLPGSVCLGIRKPLVLERTEEREPQTNEDQREESSHENPSVSVTTTPLPVPKGFGDNSILPEDLRLEEPELILDGGLPRYTSPLTSNLLSTVPAHPHLFSQEGTEMAVDDDVDREREEVSDKEEEERGEQMAGSYPRKDPPSWEEWELSQLASPLSSSVPGATEEDEGREETQKAEPEDSMSTQAPDHSDSATFWSCPRDTETDSELTLTDTDTESLRVIDTERRKRRSHGGAAPPIRGGQSDLPEREDGEGEETPTFSHWGPPRRVEVWPEAGQSLGISIVGGRHVIKRLRNGEELKGIFIKQVLPDSPAAQTQCLKTGDKILQVSGVDLQTASHEEAVQAIKSASSPVVFVVQSLSATPRKVDVVSPPVRLPPPYRPPGQLEVDPDPYLEQARGRVA